VRIHFLANHPISGSKQKGLQNAGSRCASSHKKNTKDQIVVTREIDGMNLVKTRVLNYPYGKQTHNGCQGKGRVA